MSIFRRGDYPLETTKEDVGVIFELVRNCPYILLNSDYKSKADNTKIYFDESTVFNAYANVGRGESLYMINIYAGICNAFRLGGLIISEFDSSKDLQKFINSIKWLGDKISSNGANFSLENCNDGIEFLKINMKNNICKEAKSFTAGSLLTVIGHEQGHVCLSHVLRGDTGEANSRNDERAADLFACSVAESTPFARYSVLGGLLMEIIFCWAMPSYGPDNETTHPHSRERVHNWLNSHREYLASFGISSKNIDQFLP